MGGSVNKCIIVGNLGADPDVRRLQDGSPIVNLSVATSETWRDKQSGDRREKTEWHRVVIFNENLVKVAEQYLRKGSKIFLEGSLQTRSWEDQSGQKRYATEIVLQKYRGELTMLDGKSDSDLSTPSQPPSNGSNASMAGGEMDDDIPFAPEVR